MKNKPVRTYKRRSKTGKLVTVKSHMRKSPKVVSSRKVVNKRKKKLTEQLVRAKRKPVKGSTQHTEAENKQIFV